MNRQTPDIFHFILSLVVVVGGGYLMASRTDLQGEVSALLGTVLGWWFTKANNGANGNGNYGQSGSLNGAVSPPPAPRADGKGS
jgi:hypothetical protein